jgi:hypothetical protein
MNQPIITKGLAAHQLSGRSVWIFQAVKKKKDD